MEKLSWFLIGLGLVLWVQKELFSDNSTNPPLGSGRQKIQEIDSRMYR